jgi:hypothetical protein
VRWWIGGVFVERGALGLYLGNYWSICDNVFMHRPASVVYSSMDEEYSTKTSNRSN